MDPAASPRCAPTHLPCRRRTPHAQEDRTPRARTARTTRVANWTFRPPRSGRPQLEWDIQSDRTAPLPSRQRGERRVPFPIAGRGCAHARGQCYALRVNRPLPSLAECYAFPLSSPQARRDVFIGGTLLLLTLPGWILNLGHRLDVVQRVYHDDPPYFRGFAPFRATYVRGLRAFCAISLYLSPAALLGAAALALAPDGHGLDALRASPLTWRPAGTATCTLLALALSAFALAIFSLPGGMTYNAAFNDISYLYRPDRAFRRAVAGGRAYLRAWLIGASAILLSTLGVVGFGIGFLYTSVWAWSVVGYAFSRSLVFADPTPRADANATP